MPINNCSQEDILAMRRRLEQRRLERKYEAEMDEAVKLAGRKAAPFAEAPAESEELGRVRMLVGLGMIAIAGATAWNITGNPYGLGVFLAAAWMAWEEARRC